MNIKPIIAVLTIAGTTFALTGCEPLENALAVMNNGQPMPGGPSSPVVSLHVSSVPQEVAQVAEVPAMDPADCVVPAHLFRSMQCDEGGNLVPIR